MTDVLKKFSLVLTSCTTKEQASELAELLVCQKLAACVSIIPQITSVYYWENTLQKESESLLLIKTCSSKIDELQKCLIKAHQYEVPEFIVINPEKLSYEYGKWILSACQIEN
jgi:periplasmic divalent cation tolerance protein